MEFSSRSSSGTLLHVCVYTGESGPCNLSSAGVEAAFGLSLPLIVNITKISRSFKTALYRIEGQQTALPLDYTLVMKDLLVLLDPPKAESLRVWKEQLWLVLQLASLGSSFH